MRQRYTIFWLFLLLQWLAVSSVSAQPSWLVLPSTIGTGGDPDHVAREMSGRFAAELERRGASVLDSDVARQRFEANGSAEPMVASNTDLDQLAKDAQMALYHVASGLTTRARDDVERALSRADKVLESLNRETIAAKQLLDACLFLVRALLIERSRSEARQQALECRRIVPDIVPEVSVHPPDVIGVLAEAEAELDQRQPGSLRVTSEPSGCAVYIQGRRLGTSPLELPQLSPGEYRIQVECVPGELGRVHRVTIGSGRVVRHVDTHFDQAVHTAIDVSLRYVSHEEQDKRALANAVEIGRIVGVSDVVLVAPEPGSTRRVRATRLDVAKGEPLAGVLVSIDDDGEVRHGHLPTAVAALESERFVDLSGAEQRELAPPQLHVEPAAEPQAAEQLPHAEQAPPRDEPPSASKVWPWVGAGAGLVAHGVGWVLYAQHLELESDYRQVRDLAAFEFEAQRRVQRVDDFALLPPLTAGAGAAVLTASLPWLLPPVEGVPPLAIASGVAGLGVAGTSAFFLVDAAGCDDFDRRGRCTDAVANTRLGAVMATTAAPLLGVPVVYLVRELTGSEAQLALEASPRGFSVAVGGRL